MMNILNDSPKAVEFIVQLGVDVNQVETGAFQPQLRLILERLEVPERAEVRDPA